jgi:hypothetical protein
MPSEFTISRFHVNQDELKGNNVHRLLVYADNMNMLSGSVHAIKENRSLVVSSKKVGLQVNADKKK